MPMTTQRYTKQQLFDINWAAFVVARLPQSAAIVDSFPQCLYAGPDHTGCAIGVALPRALAERMDNLKFGTINRPQCKTNLTSIQKRALSILPDDLVFLRELQAAHDGFGGCAPKGAPFHDWMRTRLEGIAKRYDLKIPDADITFEQLVPSPTDNLVPA